MKVPCDCIIPFFNEGIKPLYVVESVLKIKQISKIIIVDDGSSDKSTYKKLRAKFPQIIAVRLEKNSGKANAVREGLKRSTAEYIFLMDGDHTNIKTDEMENAILKITHHFEIDMIILRKIKDETVMVSRYFRHDIIFSGERILKINDLKEIYKRNFSGYQIEVAINSYMMKNKKRVYWMPSSVNSHNKWQKWGWIEGTKRALNMFKGFIEYAGWRNFIWQTLFFCRQKVS